MSIEFLCSQCGQKLRVSDDAAGKQARCPKCSQLNEVPQAEKEAVDFDSLPEVPQAAPKPDPLAANDANPYSAPQAGYEAPPSVAPGSPFGDTEIHNVQADVGSILNYSIEVWKENLGLLVGATVVVIAVNLLISYASGAIVFVMIQADHAAAAQLFNVVASLANNLVQFYLGVGLALLMLKLARNQPAEFSDLFSGGPRFLPAFGVYLLFMLAVFGGLLLLIVPGIIVILMWWPVFLLVVDGKADVMESFTTAKIITKGNFGTTFLVWLLSMGISLIGLFACCVGVIFAYPLTILLFVVAYLMMSGQLPLDPRAMQHQKPVM